VAGGVAVMLLFLVLTAGSLPAFGDDFLRALGAERLPVSVYSIALAVVLCVPAVVGVFWGAPLVSRELESGTHRLVWNQSVSRTRWLATKLVITGVVAIAIVAVLSLVVTLWAGSLDDAVNAGQSDPGVLGRPRIAPPVFEARGLAPLGYTAFALALGVAVGTVVRRVVPAMAVTLAIFIAVQIVVPTFVREHLGATSTTSVITADNLQGLMIQGAPGADGIPDGPVQEVTIGVDEPGAWLIANQTIDRKGRVQDELPSWFAACVPAQEGGFVRIPPERSAACFTRARSEGYRQRVTFMPASDYWTLQAIETAIFLALAGLLAAGSFWWLRHRVT